MTGQRFGKLLLAVTGRLMLLVLCSLLGALTGGSVGYWRAWVEANAVPPAPPTMGSESSGVAAIIVFGIYIAAGAGVGAILGLTIGAVSAFLWSLRPNALRPRVSDPGR